MSVTTKVSYNPHTKKFSLWKREWYFQGDKPDYTKLSDLTKEEALALVEAGAYSDFDLEDLKDEDTYNREYDRFYKEMARKPDSG